MQLFRVKVCGVTRPEDARLVAELGADAIGLNFVAGSPRCLDLEAAQRVAAAIPEGVVRIGVFAGVSADVIQEAAEVAGLGAIQLHGELWDVADEKLASTAAGVGDRRTSPELGSVPVDPPGRCGELRPLPVIRAVHLGAEEPQGVNRLAAANRWVEEARAAGAAPAMLLVDATVARETSAAARGGTGRTVDWAGLASAHAELPLALAGGLRPGNVAEAIAASGAVAVDVASGVESAPGIKDADLVRQFVSQAIAALPPPEGCWAPSN